MLARRLAAPSLLISAFLALHCSDDSKSSGDDDDAGEGGEGQGGSASGKGGKGGASGSGQAGTALNAGTSGSATGGSSGTTSDECVPRATLPCTGVDGCDGTQTCGSNGLWEPCDCGGGTGGMSSGGTGGTNSSEGGEGGHPDATGGGSGTAGEDSGGSSGTSGTAGSSGTGGSANTGGNGGGGGTAGTAGSAGSNATGGTSGGGSGGTSGGGSGGTSGKGGSGGSAGTGGKGGSGGSAGSCAPADGLELLPEPGMTANSGWVSGSTNCVGVQGAIYVRTDPGGSEITLTESDGRICIEGVAAQVLDEDYSSYWGAVVTLQLNNPGTGSALNYNALPYGVDGFEFTLTGRYIPEELRARYVAEGAEYCKQICAEGNQSILFSEAHYQCWYGGGGLTPVTSALTLLEFHVPSVIQADQPFDFCIEDLTAIIDNQPVGNPGGCGGVVPELDSCENNCGLETLSGCFCDDLCDEYGDCCPDYAVECG